MHDHKAEAVCHGESEVWQSLREALEEASSRLFEFVVH